MSQNPFSGNICGHPKAIRIKLKRHGFLYRWLFPKGVHQVYRLLLSGLLHFIVKLVSRASIHMPLHLISTYPCKKIWGVKKALDSEEARLAWCANLYFHSLRSAVSQSFAGLVGYMNGLFKLVAPSQW